MAGTAVWQRGRVEAELGLPREPLSVRRMERAELIAMADFFAAAREAGRTDVSVVRLGDAAALFAPPWDQLSLNRVLGFGGGGAPVEDLEDLARGLVEAYRARGVRRFMIHGPPDDDPETTEALETLGFRLHDRWVRLWRDASPTPWVLTELDVVRAGPEHAEAFGALDAASFGWDPSLAPWSGSLVGCPGWEVYVGVHGGEVAAAGAFHVQGDTAWLGFCSTAPAWRGRGAQTAILAEMALQAGRRGCRHLVAETEEDLPGRPSPSLRNGLRLGFRPMYRRANWVLELEEAAG